MCVCANIERAKCSSLKCIAQHISQGKQTWAASTDTPKKNSVTPKQVSSDTIIPVTC